MAGECPRHKVVVCDTGTGFVKCGFAGDNFPRSRFPCMTGRPVLRQKGEITSEQIKDLMVGEECTAHPEILELKYPVSQGVVQDWGDMTSVWSHAFTHHLRADPTECKIMLTEPPLNPVANRDKMIQTMFEEFGFQAAFVQIQAVLTLYAQGLLSGLVLDSGDGVTHAVPVWEGFSIPQATRRLNLAGQDVTAHLLDLMIRSGYALNPATDFELVRKLKEELCYVANDYKRELQPSHSTPLVSLAATDYGSACIPDSVVPQLAKETTVLTKSYTLPDGHVLKVGAERFMACEALFRPEMVGMEDGGISQMVYDCIQDVDIDIRMPMYRSILLSGGTTMAPGLASRMQKDIKEMYLRDVLKGDASRLKNFRLRVEDPPQRGHMVFLGAGVLADVMKDSSEFWITKAEYEEDPRRAVLKCGGQAST